MTNQSSIEFRPVDRDQRINSMDIIRGIALLGILLMNITGFGLPFAYGDPTNAGGSTGWNLKVWIMDNMFFEGTMRGLFTMLFGAGFILLTTRAESQGGGIKVADLYYRRILWLLLFGIIHVYLMLWYGDILYPYALFGLMLFPLRNTKPKYLLIAGLVLLTIGSIKSINHYNQNVETKTEGLVVEKLKANNEDVELTKEQEKALGKWEELKKSKKTEDEVNEAIKENQEGYWSIVKSRYNVNEFMQANLVYEFWVWDILSFMLIGIAFFKWSIFHAKRSFKFYTLLMLVGYAVGLLVNYYETAMIVHSDFDVIEMSKADQTYQLGRLFTTLGHIGLFMLFIKSGILKFLQNALAAVGKMALTNYLMHTVICTTFFLGYGFGMFGKLQRYELYYVVIAIWVVQLIYSPIWLKYFRYGPAEWLWRSLSYKKLQPFKLTK
ncbi:DUF418 domain-containing protein [Litoribaculum gwangyangense]|uniref:DUF418 domain-containing protein n=1 Tax=Litoribaculum gwangyangense TaxID=1130722 RepID=A0ABP9CLY1_9FLAO